MAARCEEVGPGCVPFETTWRKSQGTKGRRDSIVVLSCRAVRAVALDRAQKRNQVSARPGTAWPAMEGQIYRSVRRWLLRLIVVNEYLEASRAGVYAAGDVANYPDTIFGKRRRVEHWDNAVSQGQHWTRVVLGERQPFVHVPYFFSDVFDLSYELWGDPAGANEIVVRGDSNTSSFSVWWLKDNRMAAAFVMNRPDEERQAAPEWIKSSQTVSRERLSDKKRTILEEISG